MLPRALILASCALLAPTSASAWERPLDTDSFAEGMVVLDGRYGCSKLVPDPSDEGGYTCPDGPNRVTMLSLDALYDSNAVEDIYDVVIFISDFDQSLGDALAYYVGFSNFVAGINKPIGSYFEDLSLPGIVNMNDVGDFPADFNASYAGAMSFFDVLGQEVGHQFGPLIEVDWPEDRQILLGRSGVHWSFWLDTDGSVMEGSKWRDEGDGTFFSVDPDGGFSPLDQYLWGFRPAEEVSPFFVITGFEQADVEPATISLLDPTECSDDEDCPDSQPGVSYQVCQRTLCEVNHPETDPTFSSDCDPGVPCSIGQRGQHECQSELGECSLLIDRNTAAYYGVTVRGQRRDFTIEDVIDENGVRDPDYFAAAKVTKQLFVLITRPDELPAPTADCVEGSFERVASMRQEWNRYFYRTTEFRGRAITTVEALDDMPLWEWGHLSREGLDTLDATERWTAAGSPPPDLGTVATEPVPCRTDEECDDGQPCQRGACLGSGTALRIVTNGGAARIESPEMKFHALDYNVARVTLRSTAGNAGRLYYSTESPPRYDDEHSVTFPLPTDGQRHVTTAFLGGASGWQGDVTGLAVAPSDAAATVEIDRLELVKVEQRSYCGGALDDPRTPCFTSLCIRVESRQESCTPACEPGFECRDGACQLPEPCQQSCECELGFSCEPAPPCPDGLPCEVVVPDRDGDGYLDEVDNCPRLSNPDQTDGNRDGFGDFCEDYDSDGIPNGTDNCPTVVNARQSDDDVDGQGDVCDPDFEGRTGQGCRAAGAESAAGTSAYLLLLLLPWFRRFRRA